MQKITLKTVRSFIFIKRYGRPAWLAGSVRCYLTKLRLKYRADVSSFIKFLLFIVVIILTLVYGQFAVENIFSGDPPDDFPALFSVFISNQVKTPYIALSILAAIGWAVPNLMRTKANRKSRTYDIIDDLRANEFFYFHQKNINSLKMKYAGTHPFTFEVLAKEIKLRNTADRAHSKAKENKPVGFRTSETLTPLDSFRFVSNSFEVMSSAVKNGDADAYTILDYSDAILWNFFCRHILLFAALNQGDRSGMYCDFIALMETLYDWRGIELDLMSIKQKGQPIDKLSFWDNTEWATMEAFHNENIRPWDRIDILWNAAVKGGARCLSRVDKSICVKPGTGIDADGNPCIHCIDLKL